MSYLVLARKWRPQTFDDLTGQKPVVQTLENALSTGRVAHAYLFSGVRGVGKTTSARILAKALNCEKGTSPSPCGVCTTCLEIADGKSLDVIEIDGASNTGVDDIRELRDNVKYAPSKSRFKVFIIDEVHMLSTAAFNALLKTLEEPPSHVVFIFATTESHKLPATILSRCQHFIFRKIPVKDVAARLRFIVDQEGIEVDDSSLLLLARASGGSLRDSLSLLDQAISFCGSRVTVDDLQTLLGLTGGAMVREAIDGLARRDGSSVLDVVKRLTDTGQDLKSFTADLVGRVRDMIVLKTAVNPADLLDLTDQEIEDLKGAAGQFSFEELQSIFQLFMKVDADIRFSAHPRYTLEIALLRAVQLPALKTLGELIQQLSSGSAISGSPAASSSSSASRAASTGGPSPARSRNAFDAPASAPARQHEASASPSSAATSAATVAGSVNSDNTAAPEPSQSAASASPIDKPSKETSAQHGDPLDEMWAAAVADIRKVKPQVAPLLEQGVFIGVESGLLTLGYRPEMVDFAATRLCRDDVREIIENAVSSRMGQAVRLNCSLLSEGSKSHSSLAEKTQEKARKKEDSLRQEALSEPLVKSALDIFGGELAGVRPVETIQE